MRIIFLTILLISSIIVLADETIKFYGKPCYIYDDKRNIRYVLNCPNLSDSIKPCNFIVKLKVGNYKLISKDSIDTLFFSIKKDTIIIK